MADNIGYEEDIKVLFTQEDQDCMDQFAEPPPFNLFSYESVRDNADRLWGRIGPGNMPPGGWPQADRDKFKAWMDAGKPQHRASSGEGCSGG